jgi:hypothetical protein
MDNYCSVCEKVIRSSLNNHIKRSRKHDERAFAKKFNQWLVEKIFKGVKP